MSSFMPVKRKKARGKSVGFPVNTGKIGGTSTKKKKKKRKRKY